MIQLDPWQEEIMEAKGDMVLCTGRRVGKTYIFTRKAVEKMVKDGTPFIVVSLTEDQAMIIISMAVNYAKEFCPKLIGKGKYKPTLKTFTIMRNKKPILMKSRPVGATGDSVRGFEGGVLFVDEASRMPKTFWMAAKPVILTTNGEIWMCSTPCGKQGYFWEKFNESYNLKDPKARFKAFYTWTEKVMEERPISSSWTKEIKEGAARILAEEKSEMSELEYGQEFMGLFLDELRQAFSEELIQKICTLERRQTILKGRTYYMGNDIGGLGKDVSTYEVFDGTNPLRIEQVENKTTKKTYTTEVTDRIIGLDLEYNFDRRSIGVDDGGIGFGVYSELLKDSRTKRKVVNLNNAKRVAGRKKDGKEERKKLQKAQMYHNFSVMAQRDHVKLLRDDDLIASVRNIQYDPIEDKYFGTNTHIMEGIIRALWLIKEKRLNTFVY